MRLTWPEIRYNFVKKQNSVRFRGVIIPIDHSLVGWSVVKRLIRGDYEAPELDGIFALLRDDDRLIEFGSGTGAVSSVIALSRPKVEVLTVEANPAMLAQVERVHRANRLTNVTLRHGIVTPGKTTGHAEFFQHRSFAESSIRESDGSIGRIDVPEIAWTTVRNEFEPTILLCDIEGGEVQLLPELDYSGIRAVVVEFHPKVTSPEEIRTVFLRLLEEGFSPVIEHSAGTVVAFQRTASSIS